MSTLDTKDLQIAANLEYIRNNFRFESKEHFALALGISPNAYNSYTTSNIDIRQPVGEINFKKIMQGLAQFFSDPNPNNNKELRIKFPNGITSQMLQGTDLSQMTLPSEQDKFYDKFWGVYLCYYISTDTTKREPQLHYGVLQMCGGNGLKQTECACKGIFTISDFDDALNLFNEVKKNQDFPITPLGTIFTGNAHISSSVLWIDMHDDAHLEHVAMSFDFDSKVLTRHSKEEKDFIGARGIALSQSHGQGSKSVSFPIAIAKHPLQASELEITHHLSFGCSKINEKAILRSAKNVVRLNASITENNNLHLDDNAALLVSLMQYEIKRLLNESLLKSAYYQIEEQSEFYHNILKIKKDS